MNIPLLNRLRDAGGAFVPFDALGVDSVAVGRDLDELSAFGFVIERHPTLGVAFRAPAVRLCPDQIEAGLATVRIGRNLAVWNRVASTNDLAARASRSTANEGLVILAEEQTSGRGRRGRVWTAPPRSSLLMSVVLFPRGALAEPGWLTALAALSVADVVSFWTGADARIKWPNDVRVHGRKVAGILVEQNHGTVLGIGLNANLTRDQFPDELRENATSLLILRGEPVDRSDLARDLITRLDALHALAVEQGPEVLREPWRARSEHFGRAVRVATPEGDVTGRLVETDPVAGLSVLAAEGSRSHIPSARVLSLKAAEDPRDDPTGVCGAPHVDRGPSLSP